MEKDFGLTDEEKMLEAEVARKQRILELRKQNELLNQELGQPTPVNMAMNGQPVITHTQTQVMTVKKEFVISGKSEVETVV